MPASVVTHRRSCGEQSCPPPQLPPVRSTSPVQRSWPDRVYFRRNYAPQAWLCQEPRPNDQSASVRPRV